MINKIWKIILIWISVLCLSSVICIMNAVRVPCTEEFYFVGGYLVGALISIMMLCTVIALILHNHCGSLPKPKDKTILNGEWRELPKDEVHVEPITSSDGNTETNKTNDLGGKE